MSHHDRCPARLNPGYGTCDCREHDIRENTAALQAVADQRRREEQLESDLITARDEADKLRQALDQKVEEYLSAYACCNGHECGCGGVTRLQQLVQEEAGTQIDTLRKQLPEGMKHCTIVFKECEKGHGWLTATNWVQHPCPTCEQERLKAALTSEKSQRFPWMRSWLKHYDQQTGSGEGQKIHDWIIQQPTTSG